MKNLLTFILTVLFCGANAQPNISIENVVLELKPNNILSITYDLIYPTNDLAEVTFRATGAGGLLFDYNTDNATGDVGGGLSSGTELQIEWDYSAYTSITDDFRLMLVAKLNQGVDIQELVEQVDSTRLSGDMAFLEGIRHRTTGAAHLAEVQDFIRNHFLDNQLETTIETFSSGNYTAKNIIGRKIGTSDEAEVYILDGHYDSVSDSPGADDNASAIAGMLEAMRILSPYGFKKTIRFIGFDLEEAGLLGSINYVQNDIAPEENINGVLNFEMIGYYSNEPNSQDTPVGFSLLFPDAYAQLEANEFRGDFINLVANAEAQPLVTAYETALTIYVPSLNFISMEAPSNWPIVASDLGRSDHAPFWSANLPAIMLTDGANFRNPYYHTPDDTSDKLNYTFMHDVVQATIATLAEVAEIEHAATWWRDTDFATPTHETDACRFQVSPNPARDFIHIQWPDCLISNLEIELIDINGRAVKKLPQHQPGQSRQIDVKGLEKGIYFLKITSANREWTEKVVVD